MNPKCPLLRLPFVWLSFATAFFSLQLCFAQDGKQAPLALIYKGPGSCSTDEGDAGTTGYGCSEASADVAALAGFRVKFVGPNDLPETATADQVAALFENAKVWIQPGGIAVTASFAMNDRLRSEIVNFVQNGGGYVGFCAGAYIATERIGKTGYAGLDIFPGTTAPYSYDPVRNDTEYGLLSVTWQGVPHTLYFEGGPYLWVEGTSAEPVATFDATGLTAAARANFGKGRVFLSAPHPEAPAVWTTEDGITDPDGSDAALAVDMIRWASQLE